MAYAPGPLSRIIPAGGMTLKLGRQNILLCFSIGTILPLIPYALIHLIEGSSLLSFATLLSAIALGTITWQVSQESEKPVSYIIVVAILRITSSSSYPMPKQCQQSPLVSI